jgi:hypothetical protein
MISYELTPKAAKDAQVEIYWDGELVKRCSLAERQTCLEALGYEFPKPVNVRRGAKNGYGKTKSGRWAA